MPKGRYVRRVGGRVTDKVIKFVLDHPKWPGTNLAVRLDIQESTVSKIRHGWYKKVSVWRVIPPKKRAHAGK